MTPAAAPVPRLADRAFRGSAAVTAAITLGLARPSGPCDSIGRIQRIVILKRIFNVEPA
jgi:hypothetical protein